MNLTFLHLELMLLGFISLLLTVSEKRIANICIAKNVGEAFLPCNDPLNDSEEEAKCQEQGKVSLLSRQGVRELQYLMFTLAFFHCLSCVLTFSLGMAKMRRWKSWEAETTTLEYLFSNGKLLGLGTVEKVGQDFELLG
ncbi:MLO-like protein 12 [Gossypium australe]|uniref:MLO-like protein 12 n=1 Tax=Gossypium australe TaxID=47621 RepID=A0A5B6WBH5_9ROSI|nr:MLO-like protein 12 [Gossypium australe]